MVLERLEKYGLVSNVCKNHLGMSELDVLGYHVYATERREGQSDPGVPTTSHTRD